MTPLQELISTSAIADRALQLFRPPCYHREKLDAMMDIQYTHEYIALDLDKLLRFDDENFAHDILGIYRHMNRQTKQLENCFVPRSAQPETPCIIGQTHPDHENDDPAPYQP